MQVNTLHSGNVQLINADCLEYLKTIPDNSIDLILTDPPYFKVKTDKWDNQWDNVEHFLAWLDEILVEFWRVLKPAGSLYLFCSSKLASDTEILIRSRFEILAHVVWAKPSGPWRRMHKPDLRTFFPSTERIIFAGHYNAEGYAKGSSGYATKCADLKRQVFKPLMDYFIDARKALNISAKEINKATGTQMCSHWFSESQWALPNEKQYKKLQKLFQKKADTLSKPHHELVSEFEVLKQNYSHLVKSYDELKAQYQSLRRPFAVTSDVPYTDVWQFAPVQTYPGKHPCEKPLPLLEHAIQSSSRPGDVVLDCFMGSGSAGKACINLKRRFIGVELEEERFKQTLKEIQSI